MAPLAWLVGIAGTGLFLTLLGVIILVPIKWEGTPAGTLVHVKCTRCRGGMQAITPRGWTRLPDHMRLLHRKPTGDTWGSPQANIRDCPCCLGLGVHSTTSADAARWTCP
jgi:hypothetical protein